MKPNGNAPGSPFNFDALAMWVYPDVWDETKNVKWRGLWFVGLYTLSVLIFFGLFLALITLFFSKPLSIMILVWLILGVPSGIVYGLATWWDYLRALKK